MIFALIGLLGFGLSDFTIVYLTKSAGFIKGMLWNTIFMTVYLSALVFIFGRQGNILYLNANEIAIGSIAGFLTTLGGLAFFRGTQEGNISVLSPIASTYSVLIIIFSVIFLTEVLKPIQMLSILAVIVGTILVSTNLKEIRNLKLAIRDKSVPYGMLAMLFWATSFIIIGDLSVKIGWLETIFLTTISGLLILLIITPVKEKGLGVGLPSVVLAALVGVFSTMGYLGYSSGVSSTYASIVAPVVAASPLVTVILALIFLKEKLFTEQKVGILILIAGLVTLAA